MTGNTPPADPPTVTGATAEFISPPRRAGSWTQRSGADGGHRAANRGGQLMTAFLKHADVEIVALCDVRKSHMETAKERLGGKAEIYGDFRKLLDPRPRRGSHRHPRPLARDQDGRRLQRRQGRLLRKAALRHHPRGPQMVEAARRNHRMVQVGTPAARRITPRWPNWSRPARSAR